MKGLVFVLSILTLSCVARIFTLHADEQAISTALHHARRYASVFEFPHEIEVKVVADSLMPVVVRDRTSFQACAYTTRRSLQDEGCMLTFTSESVRSKLSIAHEVCHCAVDYSRLTMVGYAEGTSMLEILERERAAQICAVWLTDERAAATWERRKRHYPAAIGFVKPEVR